MAHVIGTSLKRVLSSQGATDDAIKQLSCNLHSTELARLDRFRHPADALRFAAGRALARRIVLDSQLQTKLGCLSPLAFTTKAAGGKPQLTEEWQPFVQHMVDFNISHDGDWVIAGYTTQGFIGVDIAKISCPANMTDIDYIKEFVYQLSIKEMDYLVNSSQQTLLDFYRIWTAKEAYVKAIGAGIAEFDLCSISVHLVQPAGNPRVYINGKESEFYFKSGTLDAEDYVYCIATSSEPNCAFSTTDLLDFIESSHRTAI